MDIQYSSTITSSRERKRQRRRFIEQQRPTTDNKDNNDAEGNSSADRVTNLTTPKIGPIGGIFPELFAACKPGACFIFLDVTGRLWPALAECAEQFGLECYTPFVDGTYGVKIPLVIMNGVPVEGGGGDSRMDLSKTFFRSLSDEKQ
jgi:hypothetical protein